MSVSSVVAICSASCPSPVASAVVMGVIDIVHGKGYRISTSNRTIGGPTSDPDGFTVYNQSTRQTFVAQGGVWTNGGVGTFLASLLTSWFSS